MSEEKKDATPAANSDKPVAPQFPTGRIELNDIPVKPVFPTDRIEKGQMPGEISKSNE